jgi:hypothetical protein
MKESEFIKLNFKFDILNFCANVKVKITSLRTAMQQPWREKRLEMALIQISVPARENYSHKWFLNIDAKPMASFAFLPGAFCFFI